MSCDLSSWKCVVVGSAGVIVYYCCKASAVADCDRKGYIASLCGGYAVTCDAFAVIND